MNISFDQMTVKEYNGHKIPVIPVRGTALCGAEFPVVAWVLEQESQNPCLLLEKPLGFNTIERIMNAFREKPSLVPSNN